MVDDEDDALQRTFLADWLGRPAGPPVHRIPDSHAFARAIEAGLGWGLVPEEQGRAALAAGTLEPLSATRHRDGVLHWHAWELPTRAVADVGEHLVRFAGARLRRPTREELWPTRLPRGGPRGRREGALT